MSINKVDLRKIQIDSISNIKEPLTYHFNRFVLFEKNSNPGNIKKWESCSKIDRIKYFQGQKFIKYEIEAYIGKLGKFTRFCFELSKELNIEKPEEESLVEIWDSFRDGGVIKILRDKWTAHRSYDKPKEGDTDSLHLQVLLNLEGPVTFWTNGHFILEFKEFSFDLCDYHPKLIVFLDWFFDEIKKVASDKANSESEK